MPSGHLVLLAEDNSVNQDIGRSMLEILGFKVDVAGNGREAVRLMKSNRYDLVLMDCQMPEMDGWEATRKIREAENGCCHRTPIIALTGYSMDDEREQCLAAGMDDFLNKPFGLSDLSEVLNRWVELGVDEATGEGTEAGGGCLEPESSSGAGSTGLADFNRPRSPLDPAVLNNIRSVFGAGARKVIDVVIQIYLSDSPSLLEELSRGVDSNDAKALGKAAHALKSSSANMGAMVLSGLCKEAEKIAKAGSISCVVDLVNQIGAEYRAVRQALKEEICKGA